MDADRDPATGLLYIVFEYVDGGSVGALLRKGAIEERRALAIVAGVAEALAAAAERHIVHRDIKPDNIMLTAKGEVKLADLGLAKDCGEDMGMTLPNTVMGTPAYLSPEQARNARDADARSDIYSLGATLYRMVTGRAPFEGETTFAVLTKIAQDPTPDPREKNPQLSPANLPPFPG